MGKIELQTPTSLPLVANEGQAEKMDYSGPFLYENNVLKCIFTSAGRILTFTNDGDVLYKFEYNLNDHLGNTRVVFGGHSSGKTELIQRTDYYPFGLVMAQQEYIAYEELPGHEAHKNKYLYNGKEWQDDEIGGVKLDWYDYGARMYDPELGRFHTQDRFAEKYLSLTPYHYGANSPINYVDFNGDSIVWVTTGEETEKIQSQIDEMRTKSKLFNTLMTELENMERVVEVGVSDKKVDEAAEKAGMNEEDSKRAEGFSSGGKSIYFRANASNDAFSEEMFHQFQFSEYGNGRNPNEKDSEAKLFNYTVEDETSNGAIGVGLTTNFWQIAGKEVKGENAKIYNNYLKSFALYYKAIPNHPYGKYPIRLLPPDAYNKLINLKSK